MTPTCDVDTCGSARYARGWCKRHYQRWQRTGSTRGRRPQTRAEAEAALTEKCRPEGDCIIWTGYCHRTGYGQISVEGRMLRTHRFAWEVANGPIPEGMEIDHVCHNRSCINAAHLRPVTRQQNCQNRGGNDPDRKYDLPRNVKPNRNQFEVQIGKDERKFYGGIFPTVHQAEAAATILRAELFGSYAGKSRREDQLHA